MKHLLAISSLLACIAFTFTGCKKNDNLTPQNPPVNNSGTGADYNQSDTTVNLQNGRITIRIPAGAMKEGTKVSIGSSNVAFIDTAHLLHQFELSPSGTQFKKPATLTFHYDSTWLKGNSPWNIGIAYKNDKDGKWYPAVNGDVDTVNHTLSIKTTHFSHWSIYTCFHLYMQADQQLSEDYSKDIHMQTGDIGLLLLTMDEPPAWKNDPDKSKEFSNPLVASLTKPVIDPKESYSKSIAPDEWRVNGITNGDEHVGKIWPVGGAQEKLYQYLAPPKVPANNPVAVTATIHTLKHGNIILIQGVEIMGKWKLNVTDTTVVNSSDGGFKMTENFSGIFHINNDNEIVFDDEGPHHVLKYYDWYDSDPYSTSTKLVTTAYPFIKNITGTYESKTNLLHLAITTSVKQGKWTLTVCTTDGCESETVDGNRFQSQTPLKDMILKAESGYTATWDTTATYDGGTASAHTTFRLESVK